MQESALTFLVSEETAPANDLGNLRRHHLVPVLSPVAMRLSTSRGKDRQIFGIIVIQLHETAATDMTGFVWELRGAR